MGVFLKAPEASLDYAIDWAESYLGGAGIAESNWVVDPEEDGGVELISQSLDNMRTVVQLSGGEVGKTYRIKNQIILTNGIADERSFIVRVGENA